MRTIISIDVGIVKLAFALFKQAEDDTNGAKEPFLLDKWAVINLTKDSVDSVSTTCIECVKKATCTKGSLHYCAKHGKKSGGLLPSSELKLSNINKLKKESVVELLTKLGLPIGTDTASKNKKDLILAIKDHLEKNVLTPIVKTNASKLDLNIIGRNIKNNFDEIFADDKCHIDEVIIENQIGPQAIRMKAVQGMLSQYFIMRHDNVTIKFVNASNKLKGELFCNPVDDTVDDTIDATDTTVTTYKDRKEMGIQMCKNIIQTNPYKKWSAFIESKKKVTGIADLSDCFLQGLWYISTLK
jgi:hypothetical protein